jgi:formylglycine-generating enzyme required for sulfatase activity
MNYNKCSKSLFSLLLFLITIILPGNGLSVWKIQPLNKIRSGKDYALFFAVEDYENWSDLKNSIKDTEAIAKVLQEQYGFEDIRIEPNPSLQTVIETLTQYLLKSFDPEDQLFIFFSGHGIFNDLSNEAFFIPRDAQNDDPIQKSYLALTRLERTVASINCKHILLMIDACYSGTFNESIELSKNDPDPHSTWIRPGIDPGNLEAKQNWIKTKLEKRSRICIASGRNERTFDGIDHSPLTEAFLQNLAKPGDDAILTVDELTALIKNVQPETKVFSFGSHEPDGSFLFVRKEPVLNFGIKSNEERQKDTEAWRKAQFANTPKAYQEYLNDFLQGSFRREALKALGDAEEIQEWEFAKARNIPESYLSYLRKYPSGKYSVQAKALTEEDPVITIVPLIHSDLDLHRFNMVLLKGGTFNMGCTGDQDYDCDSSEKPVHQVTVSDFYIGKYEVTQKEWREVLGADPPGLFFKGCDNCPVEGVNWDDIQQFLSTLNAKTGKSFRLPTEAEWEYAARGGSLGQGYSYAGSNNLDEIAWYSKNSGSRTHPVGQKQSNELGLYDMSGNVYEWCADSWHGSYTSAPSTGRAWIDSHRVTNRVKRGGGCVGYPRNCRVSARLPSGQMDRGIVGCGFRLAH